MIEPIQLDFMGNYMLTTPNTGGQLCLLDDDLNPSKRNRQPNYTKVEGLFLNLGQADIAKYSKYWASVTPACYSEIFQRWLFGFMSVHTSWESNIKGYMAIKDWWVWINDEEKLKELLLNSRVGLHINRARFLMEFATKFWKDPSKYLKSPSEPWTDFRNRLVKETLGLGMAKTSFSLELCYPNEANVVCLDTHMFKIYGLDQTKDARLYTDLEKHWVEMSKMWNVPPYIARCLYWDMKQNKTDSTYWSHVIERQHEKIYT